MRKEALIGINISANLNPYPRGFECRNKITGWVLFMHKQK
jgi:hypothetical protein